MGSLKEGQWLILRAQLMDSYDSVHAYTVSKSFYADIPDSELWKNKKIWLHLFVTLFCELTFVMFEAISFTTKDTFFEALLSLTVCIISVLVLTRTYVFYTGLPTLRKLYFKPEVFNCNKHRPTSSLTRLIEVIEHGRKVGFWCIVLFIVYDAAWLILPLSTPLIELMSGTNKTYDELIPIYPSVMPVDVPWLRKEVKYAYDLIVGVGNTLPWVGSIIIFYSVVNLLATQHDILVVSLSPISATNGDEEQPIDLNLWIEDHALLRKLIFELRALVTPTLAVTVFANFFMIGLSMMALLSQPNDSDAPVSDKITYYLSFAMYTYSCLSDLFIHCWLSTVIKDFGDLLRGALYNSDWESNLKRSPADFVVPLMICNKRIEMTAFGLIPIQIQTFTEVIRIAYSYYTLLNSTGD